MSVRMTDEQLNAVNASGKIIVSASAGSGKTFVMIERLVSLILGGADLRRVLAVTFTTKAAAQIREKLRSALIRKITESGGEERARLKDQLTALPLADISTIHAFCARLVRTNFFLAEVDPSFRIISADDAEGKALQNRAIDEVFEGEYAADGDFKRLLAVYFRDKKDAQLRKIVLSLYGKVRELSDYAEVLGKTGADEFSDVCAYLAEEYRKKARFCAEGAEEHAAFFAESNGRAYKVCCDIRAAAESLLCAKTFFEMATLARTLPQIAVMPSTTKATGEERRRLLFTKELSAFCKKLYKELAKYSAEETEYLRYLDGQDRARMLAGLVLKFDAVYTRLKEEAGVLDYNDLEHLALKVLSDPTARETVRAKYAYLFVDEYQDVNPVQEKILSLVGGEEIFLVGDAKQSIYGFRGSKSEFFVRKTEEYPTSLPLSENFRCSPAVIGAVNRVFSRSMTEELCGIDYLKKGVMRGGSRYGEHSGEALFHIIPTFPDEEEGERGVYSVLKESESKRDEQAEEIVRLIANEIGTEWYDADAGLMKRVEYGDIAVLVRKKTGSTGKIVSALSARNIPVTTTAKVNVCDFWEARLVIDWLSYLDNAEQDIPMAGAMLSRVGGFTEEDLVGIRRRFPSPYTFRAACAQYREKMNDALARKLTGFAKKTETLRALSQGKRAAEVVGILLAEGLETEIAAKRDGETRLRRVRRLMRDGAECGVNAFLRHLKSTSYEANYSESGGENAVQVLTMHAVKGLEYPVVIVADLDAAFHGADTDDVMWTEKFGFAPKSYDTEQKIVYNTLLRQASALFQINEERKEELNLFYVAMTRAKYRLHLLFRGKESALSPLFARRFSDFVDQNDCASYYADREEEEQPPLARSSLAFTPNEERKRQILAVYRRPYAYEKSVSLPVKDSATGFMQREKRDAAPQRERERSLGAEPASVQSGLAYHAFLQYVRFGKDVREELSRMTEEGLLTGEQTALLDGGKLEQIMALPSLKALAGKQVAREQKFLVSLPAREIPSLDTDAEDEIVVQGAIDLLCEEEDGYTILDYKYSSHDGARLAGDYRTQLTIYRKAVAKITGTAEEKIRARILNILRLEEIGM